MSRCQCFRDDFAPGSMPRGTLRRRFSINLRRIRLERQWPQKKLAHVSRVDRAFISLLERFERQPTLTSLEAVANALRVHPCQILLEPPPSSDPFAAVRRISKRMQGERLGPSGPGRGRL